MLLGQKLGSKLGQSLNLKVSEIKEAPFFILKHSEAPGIILELGYLTNEQDRAWLLDEGQGADQSQEQHGQEQEHVGERHQQGPFPG